MFENVHGRPAEKELPAERGTGRSGPIAVTRGPAGSGPSSLHQALDLARAARS